MKSYDLLIMNKKNAERRSENLYEKLTLCEKSREIIIFIFPIICIQSV